jgi:CRP-like cAMP-binding protein
MEATFVAVINDRVPAMPPHSATANLLLSALPAEDRHRLATVMDRVHFSRGEILWDAGEGPHYTYFPTSGLTSILGVTRGGDAVGIAAIGNEGAIGWPSVVPGWGVVHHGVVEVPGSAHRIRSDVLHTAFRELAGLQDVLMAHTQLVLAQISQAVVCQRFHTVPERLARWLLIVCDHAHSNRLRLTQARIARVLGIHRTGVTEAAAELKAAGVIWYQHGQLVILNRQWLEREACDCYGTTRTIRIEAL